MKRRKKDRDFITKNTKGADLKRGDKLLMAEGSIETIRDIKFETGFGYDGVSIVYNSDKKSEFSQNMFVKVLKK